MKTLQDWINEYYPVDAQTFVANLPEGMTKVEKDIASVKHALKKWKGAKDEVLKEYNLAFVEAEIIPIEGNEEAFAFDMDSCTLCEEYFNYNDDGCAECPLMIVRKAKCYNYSAVTKSRAPYRAAVLDNDPLPMIQLLEEVLADLEHQHEEITRK